jgi:hypothetical protein
MCGYREPSLRAGPSVLLRLYRQIVLRLEGVSRLEDGAMGLRQRKRPAEAGLEVRETSFTYAPTLPARPARGNRFAFRAAP